MSSKTALFYLVGVILLTATSASEEKGKADDKKDEEKDIIAGEYTLDTDPNNEDYKKYLKNMGFSEEVQKQISTNKKVLVVIKKVNETHCQIKIVTENRTNELTYEQGKEFEAKLPDGRPVKNTITVNKKDKTAHRVIKMEGFEATDDAAFTKDGFNLTAKAKDAVAKLYFKREKSIMDSIKDWADWLKKKVVGDK